MQENTIFAVAGLMTEILAAAHGESSHIAVMSVINTVSGSAGDEAERFAK